MEQILSGLMGGGSQQQDLQDFVQRFEQGAPSEGYSDGEVAQRYQQVASTVPPQVYQQAAQEAFDRLSPQQQQQLIQHVERGAQQQGINIPFLSQAQSNPGVFGQLLTQAHQNNPGFLSQILGSVTGGSSTSGGGSNPLVKGLMAGIAAMAVKQVLNNR